MTLDIAVESYSSYYCIKCLTYGVKRGITKQSCGNPPMMHVYRATFKLGVILSEQETTQHIEDLAGIVEVFCTDDDLAAFTSLGQHDSRNVVAERILGELNTHQGEHRVALDHLNEVIDAPIVDGKRDYRCQLSAIREALRLLASRQGVSA